MKIKPEILLKNIDQVFLYKKILITGSEESFINYVKNYLVTEFKKKNYYIDFSGSYNKDSLSGDLFSDKKVLFLMKEYPADVEDSQDQSFLIISPNSKKTNSLKSKLLKSKNDLVLDCYPLSRSGKEVVLVDFIKNNKVELSNEIFWYVLENFDNSYALLLNQLESLALFNNKIESIESVEKAVFVESKTELNKIFFHIFKNNKFLINVFNKNVYSQGDFYIFLNSMKTYMEIISKSQNKEEAITKFPKYLFKEKDVFIKIYNQLNKKKILEIYKNILRVESLVRKNSNLYFEIGLRFLLSTRKVIIS